MMDDWVKLFTEKLVPMQEKHGIKIEGMWVSEEREGQGGRVLRVSRMERCNGPRTQPYSEDGCPDHGTLP